MQHMLLCDYCYQQGSLLLHSSFREGRTNWKMMRSRQRCLYASVNIFKALVNNGIVIRAESEYNYVVILSCSPP